MHTSFGEGVFSAGGIFHTVGSFQGVNFSGECAIIPIRSSSYVLLSLG
jgi:hypothetical protein